MVFIMKCFEGILFCVIYLKTLISVSAEVCHVFVSLVVGQTTVKTEQLRSVTKLKSENATGKGKIARWQTEAYVVFMAAKTDVF